MNLAELDRAEMESAFAELGIARFHGRQVFRWIHARGVTEFAQMTDLSQELRAKLATYGDSAIYMLRDLAAT